MPRDNTVTPDDALAQAWHKHECSERVTEDPDRKILLSARRRAAERFPGCARAILSDDAVSNWDRGSIIRELVDHTPR